jgi:hypothetical protein
MKVKESGFEFHISKEKKLIIERFHEEVSCELIKKASRAIWSHPDYNKYYNGLADLRGVRVSFGLTDIAELLIFFASNARTVKGKLAILVDEPIATVRGFQFQNKLSGIINAKVFSFSESAADYLGVSTEDLQTEAKEEFHL